MLCNLHCDTGYFPNNNDTKNKYGYINSVIYKVLILLDLYTCIKWILGKVGYIFFIAVFLFSWKYFLDPTLIIRRNAVFSRKIPEKINACLSLERIYSATCVGISEVNVFSRRRHLSKIVNNCLVSPPLCH